MKTPAVALLVALSGIASSAGCQRILGIHGRAPTQIDSGSEAGSGGTGGSGGHLGDASSGGGRGGTSGGSLDDAGALDQAGSDGATGSDASGSGGSGTIGGGSGSDGADAKPEDAGSGGTPPDGTGGRGGEGGRGGTVGADAGTPDASDLGAGDAKPDAVSSDAGPSEGVVSTDAGICTQPWHAEGVEARLFDVSTIAMTACSIAGSAIPQLAAAVDATTYHGAQACGACLRVMASLGSTSVVVQVVENSSANGILLTKSAMDQIAPGGSLVSVDWMLVPCDVQSQPVRYYIKDGSNAGYVGVQIRNARYPLATVSVVGSKTSVPLTLQSYNYWESTSAGAGPLTLSLTDINGQTFQDTGVKVAPQTEMVGQGQFPLCR